VDAAGTLACCRIAAGLSIFGVARRRVFAAAGLAVFPGATVLSVFGAHLPILALAAIHGRLIALRMVFAAGHLFAIFVLAAVGYAILAVAASLGVALVILVIATSARRVFGRFRSGRLLLCNCREPSGQREN